MTSMPVRNPISASGCQLPLSNEEEVDLQFFKGNNDVTLQKLKLNKGEKRALKFMIQKDSGGKSIDVDAFLKTQDIQQLKNMLAKDAKTQSVKKLREEKTGFQKGQHTIAGKMTDLNAVLEQDKMNC